MNRSLLDALRCAHRGPPPVWLMRQAGRYLPEYRELRARHSLWQLFHKPELAVEVTLQPLRRFALDAAILFSDILVIAEVFGLEVLFPEGEPPRIVPVVCSADALVERDVEEALPYVRQTIEQLKPVLDVPLLGFCGGPFTLATYMTGGQAREQIARDRAGFHALMGKITAASIAYLRMQIDAGVDALQIFDSWANLLTPEEFLEFSYAYLKQMVEALRPSGVPVILFSRAASRYPQELASLSPAAISFDSGKALALMREQLPATMAIQGNLDPEFLREASVEEVEAATRLLREAMRGDPGFIANLGHGVLPKTPLENVRAFVDTIRAP